MLQIHLRILFCDGFMQSLKNWKYGNHYISSNRIQFIVNFSVSVEDYRIQPKWWLHQWQLLKPLL